MNSVIVTCGICLKKQSLDMLYDTEKYIWFCDFCGIKTEHTATESKRPIYTIETAKGRLYQK